MTRNYISIPYQLIMCLKIRVYFKGLISSCQSMGDVCCTCSKCEVLGLWIWGLVTSQDSWCTKIFQFDELFAWSVVSLTRVMSSICVKLSFYQQSRTGRSDTYRYCMFCQQHCSIPARHRCIHKHHGTWRNRTQKAEKKIVFPGFHGWIILSTLDRC